MQLVVDVDSSHSSECLSNGPPTTAGSLIILEAVDVAYVSSSWKYSSRNTRRVPLIDGGHGGAWPSYLRNVTASGLLVFTLCVLFQWRILY